MYRSDLNEPIIWDEAARARVENAPAFVRVGVLKVTEKRARERAQRVITSAFLTEIRNESMLRAAKVIKAFGFEELSTDAFDVAKKKMKKKARKVEVIGEIEKYLGARTGKKSEIIEKFRMYLGMIPERGLPWTEEALGRIDRVPSFVRKMAESVIEEEAKKRKEKVITQEVVEAALDSLGSGEVPVGDLPFSMPFSKEGDSAQGVEVEVRTTFPWSPEAMVRLSSIPFGFVRDRILKRVEAYAEENGVNRISLDVYEAGREAAT